MDETEERRRTVEARRALGAEIILGLDDSVELREYAGPADLIEFFERFTEAGEAWRIALLSPAEALTLMREAGECRGDSEMVRDLISWCRRAVGLPEDLIFRVEGEKAADETALLRGRTS